MMDSPKIYLCGLGAIGSVFAGRIPETNPDLISVIVDKKCKAEYSRNTIMVNGKPYSFKLALPEAYTHTPVNDMLRQKIRSRGTMIVFKKL
jgi:2-dehydropantoate 2-reductase